MPGEVEDRDDASHAERHREDGDEEEDDEGEATDPPGSPAQPVAMARQEVVR